MDASPRGVAEAISYAATHGMLIGQSKQAPFGKGLCHAPFTYRPSPVDAKCYQHALDITVPLNHLVHAIAQDAEYLHTTLAGVSKADEKFTGRLLALEKASPKTDIQLSICRYDYFVHVEHDVRSLRMVELNVIAASFGALGAETSRMHRFLATHPTYNLHVDVDRLPENDALTGIARGVALAHNLFRKRYAVTGACIALMVVEPGDQNAYDQHILQAALWREHAIDLVRVTFLDVLAHGAVDSAGLLQLNLPQVGKPATASVVYFRTGYVPENYPSEKEWEARALMERSMAVKCPSTAMQLVGTKKIQQVLDSPGEVERFLNGAEASLVRRTFVRQYSLAAAEGGEAAADMAIERPHDFVLKPQREGGGHNLYDDELEAALRKMSAHERAAYVLMQRIRPQVIENIIVRDGVAAQVDVVSELGMYGVHVTDADGKVESFASGSLLRSKAASANDGGVAAGVAVLDSPYLVD